MEILKLILEFLDILIWPVVALIAICKFQGPLRLLIDRIKKAEFPGGISIETFPEEIEEAKRLSQEVKEEDKTKQPKEPHVSIPLTETNARMLNLGLDPSPSGMELSRYSNIAEQDPNLALAGLRIEVEIMLKNLAKGFKVKLVGREGAGVIGQKLREHGAITSTQYNLIQTVLKLCNSAVHGMRVTTSQAKEILDIVSVLRDDYISWLGWGFPKQ